MWPYCATVHLHKVCSISDYCASDRCQCDRPFTLVVSRLFHWSLIGICVWKAHPLSFLLSGSLNLPKPIFLFLFVTAFSGCSSYLRVLLVSCGRLSLIPIVPIWKLKGKFLLLPMGLGQWTVDHSGVWTLPSVWYGESQLWAVCTRSNSSCINLRLFQSCRDRPLSCIIWAWPTERLLGQREKIYFKLTLISSHMQRFWHLTMMLYYNSLTFTAGKAVHLFLHWLPKRCRGLFLLLPADGSLNISESPHILRSCRNHSYSNSQRRSWLTVYCWEC